jgi:hypothetical protein
MASDTVIEVITVILSLKVKLLSKILLVLLPWEIGPMS